MAPQSKVNVRTNNKKPSAPGSGAYAQHTRTLARSFGLPGSDNGRVSLRCAHPCLRGSGRMALCDGNLFLWRA